ncbi:hypothetical protein IHV25_01445 [Phaeovibrio sulfidiphilus]|uniref:Uncharacterized protein n=1 Tax=Phaeovibrio sulfidiphilus TaxID=1220600 RepID=A0A8J7CCY0_9PROT|nr:hypothetical protein [Phaeovibrio sulfidiphilus]MBE1236319.1 hypothetical protein [Phaeovibrio sulfidiphilus]
MSVGTSIGGLVRYAQGGEWRLRTDAVRDEHVKEVMEAHGFEKFEDLSRFIGPNWGMALFGAAFEDMVSRTFEDGNPEHEQGNIVEVYLRRRGWKEKMLVKGYLTSLAESVPTLLEVLEVEPGRTVLVKDTLGADAGPVLVHEKTASTMVSPGDMLAGRLVASGKKTVFGGGLLLYLPEAVTRLRSELEARHGAGPLDRETLRAAAPLFSSIWLALHADEMARERDAEAEEDTDSDAEGSAGPAGD